MNNQNLTTSEKIEELKKWVLNDEQLYLWAKDHLKVLFESGSYAQSEIDFASEKFMFHIANEANVFIRPLEIDTIREALYSIIMRIDQ